MLNIVYCLLFIVLILTLKVYLTMKDKIYYYQEKSNDILDLQDEFTVEEIGIYSILKAAYFKYSGELKEVNLCQRCKFFGNKETLLLVAKKLFESEGGYLINKSWLSEINNIKERSEKRRLAAEERWKKERKKKEAKDKQKISKSEGNKDEECKSKLESQFEEIYRLYNKEKNLKVIPFDKLKSKFQSCLKDVTFEELKQSINDYLEYLSTETWRKKKAFDAWINSPEFYANDWKNESKEGKKPDTNDLSKWSKY